MSLAKPSSARTTRNVRSGSGMRPSKTSFCALLRSFSDALTPANFRSKQLVQREGQADVLQLVAAIISLEELPLARPHLIDGDDDHRIVRFEFV